MVTSISAPLPLSPTTKHSPNIVKEDMFGSRSNDKTSPVSNASTTTTLETLSTANTNENRGAKAAIMPPAGAPALPESAPPESQLEKLRMALDDSQKREDTAKTALAKSDAVILELRSRVRELKKKVDTLQKEKDELEHDVSILKDRLDTAQSSAALRNMEESNNNESMESQKALDAKKQEAIDTTMEQVGELQVQLDRAHAQILTADMVRKELEDTLEAEQYTWELRCQDQERQISQLTQDCLTLTQDLEQCRSQWKEAEEGWTSDLQQLSTELEQAHRELNILNKGEEGKREMLEKINLLEGERDELQGYLDEAMKELEAVDRELRAEQPTLVEPLQHLYRWLMERSNFDDHEIPKDTSALLDGIRALVETVPGGGGDMRIAELEAQISVYRGDLQAREESNAELRSSLKEAVGLLKPLQDAVASSDREKETLTRQIKAMKEPAGEQLLAKEEEIAELNQRIDELVAELEQAKLDLSVSSGTPPRRTPRHSEDTSSSLRAKRDKEEALQRMFRNAQSRFQELHKTNHDVVNENAVLQQRLEETERKLLDQHAHDDEGSIKRDGADEMREDTIQQLEGDGKSYAEKIEQKDIEIAYLKRELRRVRGNDTDASDDYSDLTHRTRDFELPAQRNQDMAMELEGMRESLARKTETETILNNSLKEALSLLQPLRAHLEESEAEKKRLARQMKKYKKKIAKLESLDELKSVKSLAMSEFTQERDELEGRLRQVEAERDELAAQSKEVANAGKVQEELVEIKSRCEVTENKLGTASAEKAALTDTLKKKERAQQEMLEEISVLRDKLKKSDHELENAKYIATSALMKVEELTMDSVLDKEGNPVSPRLLKKSTDEANSQVAAMREKVRSLEVEVESAKELNLSLEDSIQDRDRMLQELAAQHSQSPERYQAFNPQINGMAHTNGAKGVTWDR